MTGQTAKHSACKFPLLICAAAMHSTFGSRDSSPEEGFQESRSLDIPETAAEFARDAILVTPCAYHQISQLDIGK